MSRTTRLHWSAKRAREVLSLSLSLSLPLDNQGFLSSTTLAVSWHTIHVMMNRIRSGAAFLKQFAGSTHLTLGTARCVCIYRRRRFLPSRPASVDLQISHSSNLQGQTNGKRSHSPRKAAGIKALLLEGAAPPTLPPPARLGDQRDLGGSPCFCAVSRLSTDAV